MKISRISRKFTASSLLIFLLSAMSLSSFANDSCLKNIIIDSTKTEHENVLAHLLKTLPKDENGIFINNYRDFENFHTGYFVDKLNCIERKINSIDLQQNDDYEFLLAQLEYLKQAGKGKQTKSQIMSSAGMWCWDLFEQNESLKRSDCFQALEKINNQRHPDEFSEELFNDIETLAKKGNLPAQYNMFAVQRYGVGTKIDLPSAYAWGSVATTINPPYGKQMVDRLFGGLSLDEQQQAELLTIHYLENYSRVYEKPSTTILNFN